MAETVTEQRARYPLAAYNFRVTIDTQSMSFARVSGLQQEHQTVVYRHGLSFREGEQLIAYPADRHASLTLERGTTRGAQYLHEWLASRAERPMDICLCDSDGAPVLVWRIARAVPVKLSVATLDARSNEVAIETLELRAAGISLVQDG